MYNYHSTCSTLLAFLHINVTIRHQIAGVKQAANHLLWFVWLKATACYCVHSSLHCYTTTPPLIGFSPVLVRSICRIAVKGSCTLSLLGITLVSCRACSGASLSSGAMSSSRIMSADETIYQTYGSMQTVACDAVLS